MINKIKEFLESNETELKLPFIPLEIYEALFEELGYYLSDRDRNYNETDFAIDYHHKNTLKCINLVGSFYDGKFNLLKD